MVHTRVKPSPGRLAGLIPLSVVPLFCYPMSTPNSEEVWIATVEVAPRDGNSLLGEAAGAFVTIMAIASNPREFRRKIYEHFERERLDIVDIRDAEPLELRQEFAELDNELKFVAATVNRTREAATGPYDSFLEDDDK